MPRTSGGGFGRSGRRGLGGGYGYGPGGVCVCPNCGYEQAHQPGVPCFSQTCPKCNTPMQRK